ncbi:MAG: hypothetical protein NZT92_03085 [Abditibacteriales bacterium]|nr:hypothetical protein [Abditibacteriales bacterium]
MKGTKRTAVCIFTTVGVIMIGVVSWWLLSHQEAPAQSGRSLLTPTWQVGDWWEVEASSLSVTGVLIEWREPQRARYKVEATVNVEGYSAYKVSLTPYSLSGALEQTREFLYFNVTDLSMFRRESLGKAGEVLLEEMQTPGQPTWAFQFPRCWPVFPLVEGKRREVDSNPFEFRRPDGTVKRLGEGQTFSRIACEPGKLYPRQEVSVETVEWGGQQRQVFRVKFQELKADGTVEQEASLRWLSETGFPAQVWINAGKGSALTSWVRLVTSSRGLSFEIPRPRVEGFAIVE